MQLSRVLLVGQAPGKANGAPITRLMPWWPIYRVMNGWMEAAGFRPGDARRVSFRNVMPFWIGERAPTWSETQASLALLYGDLEAIDPIVVVTLGRVARDAIMGRTSRPLVNDVGVVYHMLVGTSWRHVVPLPHPSGLNRMLNDEIIVERAIAGLAQVQVIMKEAASERAQRPVPRLEEPEEVGDRDDDGGGQELP